MKPLIGMLVMDRPNITKRVIDSVMSHTKRWEFEWVVLNQNSNDETSQMLHDYRKVFDGLYQMDFNTGFFGANYLMSLRKPGQSYMFWDNDCVVETSDWLGLLLLTLKRKDIGGVACRRPTFWIEDNRLANFSDMVEPQEILYETQEPHHMGIPGFMVEYIKRRGGVVACCWLVRGDVLDEIGYLNETTGMGDCEFPNRMAALGFSNALVPDAVIKQPQEPCTHPQSMAQRIFGSTKWGLNNEYLSRHARGKDLKLGSRFDSTIPMSDFYKTRSEAAWQWFKEYKDGMEK